MAAACARTQGAEVLGNLNAPPAVTASAVIYALRCLLPGDAADVPLNQVMLRICFGFLILPPIVIGMFVVCPPLAPDILLHYN